VASPSSPPPLAWRHRRHDAWDAQQRWPRVLGQTSSIAFQKPSAPSAMASSGAMVSPRRFRSSSRSRHDCALSRTPSIRPTSGSEIVPGWESSKTLVSVTAYHSFGGDVEARTPPRYAALPLHDVTNFRELLLLSFTTESMN
jgi:hypothetical protein